MPWFHCLFWKVKVERTFIDGYVFVDSCKLIFLPQVGWSKMHKLLQQRDEETKKSRYSLNEVVCNNFLQKNIYEILMQFWKVCGVDSFKWFSNNKTRDLLIKDEKLTSWWYLWALGYEFKMIRMLDLKVNTFESHSGEVYSIHHCVIMFNSCLWQLGCFLQVLQFPPPIKLTVVI